ncbi:hypothetical protein [Bradyrhizobium centrosematis]|uniref:hypothetical protein n=1 Tax=Bradyrhizobium centrosematis TaxID=1300039 RepID=UPI00389095A3
MAGNGQPAQAGVTKQTSEIPAPERGEPVADARQADRALRDALEDDEVREALDLHRRTTRPKAR